MTGAGVGFGQEPLRRAPQAGRSPRRRRLGQRLPAAVHRASRRTLARG